GNGGALLLLLVPDAQHPNLCCARRDVSEGIAPIRVGDGDETRADDHDSSVRKPCAGSGDGHAPRDARLGEGARRSEQYEPGDEPSPRESGDALWTHGPRAAPRAPRR